MQRQTSPDRLAVSASSLTQRLGAAAAWLAAWPGMAAFRLGLLPLGLTARARQVFLLRQGRGMTHGAIARHVGIPVRLVQWYLTQAMLHLARGVDAGAAMTPRGAFGVQPVQGRGMLPLQSARDAASLRQAASWYAALTADDATAHDQQRWRAWLDRSFLHRRAWACVEAVSAAGGQSGIAAWAFSSLRAAQPRSEAG